jgi:hypothetical protein
MNYVVEVASSNMIKKPSFVNNASCPQELLRGNIYSHTWTAIDKVRLLCFKKLREVGYKYFLKTEDS